MTAKTRDDAYEAIVGHHELDVRSLAPAYRHESVVTSFDRVSPGTEFVLVNDHDPKPRYDQFEAEHEGEFTGSYLEHGPRVWRVRIGRIPRRVVQ